jgi:hypothetical protein
LLTFLDFELACSFNDDPVFAQKPTDTPVADIDPNVLQFFGRSGSARAAEAKA